MNKPINDLKSVPKSGFIPDHLYRWATLEAYYQDIPAVELSLGQNGGLMGKIIINEIVGTDGDEEQRYFSDALFLEIDGKEICIFDQAIHGWDAVECNYHFKQDTEQRRVKCEKCSSDIFVPRVSWLGYQVFDGETPTVDGSIQYRNSFDSIAIDIRCVACDHNETILSAETA